ncbi:MAG: molybdenum cofactor guanylyltransferase [Mycobacteriales bacterium]
MYDALVLAGGAARRLGGVDKPALVVGGSTLLDRVLSACADAGRTVVVGPERGTARPVIWTREEPVGGGPVPALLAGLREVTADRVVLLAADLPFLTADVVRLLVDGAPAVLTDGGRPQWLCGAWPTEALRAAAAQPVDDGRLGTLLSRVGPRQLDWEGPGAPWTDCDTAEDLDEARQRA